MHGKLNEANNTDWNCFTIDFARKENNSQLVPGTMALECHTPRHPPCEMDNMDKERL